MEWEARRGLSQKRNTSAELRNKAVLLYKDVFSLSQIFEPAAQGAYLYVYASLAWDHFFPQLVDRLGTRNVLCSICLATWACPHADAMLSMEIRHQIKREFSEELAYDQQPYIKLCWISDAPIPV